MDSSASGLEPSVGVEADESVGSTAGAAGVAAGELVAERRASKWGAPLGLAAVLICGLGMRAWIVGTPGLGLADDMQIFGNWSLKLAEDGLTRFYATQRFCDYPPLGVLTFYAAGKAAVALGAKDALEPLLWMVLKIPACLADVGIALLLFVEGRRLLGRRAGLAAAALYFLNPVTLYDSAYWGQVDSIYTFFAVLALACVGRRSWMWAGAAVALGLLAKFQTIAFVPLLVFEAYRLGGWRAVGVKILAAIGIAGLATSPFALTGTLPEVLRRGYVNVVGQYQQLSKGAFNTWSLVAPLETTDAAPPAALARVAAGGQTEIAADSSWLLGLTWRRMSLVLYALSVAVVLSIYSLRPGAIARYGAAALLGLAFYLFPTEMHERYAFPALAFMALWAVSGEWRERVYFLFSMMLLLNLAFVLSPGALAPQIAGVSLLVFGWVLVALGRRTGQADAPRVALPPTAESEKELGSAGLIRWFRRATLAALVVAAGGMAALGAMVTRAPAAASAADTVYVSTLRPEAVQQSWHTLVRDGAVAGGPLRLGEMVYLRGLGTHAPSRIVYAVPTGATRFRALTGIDHGTRGAGTASVSVEVDGKVAFSSDVLRWQSEPAEVDVPVSGAKRLVLRTDPTSDGQRADHVDWALARFELGVGDEPGAGDAQSQGK